jgi:glycerate kinase
MMTIIIAPGAFKHSLSADKTALAIERGLRRSGLHASLLRLPIADGGNGTLDAFLANGGTRHTVESVNPLGKIISADWGMLPDGETAIIEMALASGIELIHPNDRNPLTASTRGTGILIRHAVHAGAKRIIVGMGGSATTDGGAGCLMELGIRFFDDQDQLVDVGGGNLLHIQRIDTQNKLNFGDIELIIATDVENPPLGDTGASAVFAPQKGATPADVITLEANLTQFFSVIHQQIGVDVRHVKGGGAAGALSAGLMAFFGGKIVSGIDLILEHNHFRDHLATADLVITGEGRMDDQTIFGKGPIGVARLAKDYGVPTIALVGDMSADDVALHEAGLSAVLPIAPRPISLQTALDNAPELIENTALRLGYLLQISRNY